MAAAALSPEWIAAKEALAAKATDAAARAAVEAEAAIAAAYPNVPAIKARSLRDMFAPLEFARVREMLERPYDHMAPAESVLNLIGAEMLLMSKSGDMIPAHIVSYTQTGPGQLFMVNIEIDVPAWLRMMCKTKITTLSA